MASEPVLSSEVGNRTSRVAHPVNIISGSAMLSGRTNYYAGLGTAVHFVVFYEVELFLFFFFLRNLMNQWAIFS